MRWGLLGRLFMLLGIGIAAYLFFYFRRSAKYFLGNKIKNKLIWLCIDIGIALISLYIGLHANNPYRLSGAVCITFLMLILLCDIISLVIRLIRRKKNDAPGGKAFKTWRFLYASGMLAAGLLIITYFYGTYNMGHIKQTSYTISSEKVTEKTRFLLLTDIHYATFQDTEMVRETIAGMDSLEPDFVVLAGDIVEQGTSRDRMYEIFEALGNIDTKYGVFYVYGNHDRQSYARKDGYTQSDMNEAMERAGVIQLVDEVYEVTDEIVIVGRDDAAWGNTSGRAKPAELFEGVDTSKYVIVADHQPIEWKEVGALGADLEVSGHTHAGQIFPIGLLNSLTGSLNYGRYNKDDITVIVSSGMAGWGFHYRTEKHCEYVVVDIVPAG